MNERMESAVSDMCLIITDRCHKFKYVVNCLLCCSYFMMCSASILSKAL